MISLPNDCGIFQLADYDNEQILKALLHSSPLEYRQAVGIAREFHVQQQYKRKRMLRPIGVLARAGKVLDRFVSVRNDEDRISYAVHSELTLQKQRVIFRILYDENQLAQSRFGKPRQSHCAPIRPGKKRNNRGRLPKKGGGFPSCECAPGRKYPFINVILFSGVQSGSGVGR